MTNQHYTESRQAMSAERRIWQSPHLSLLGDVGSLTESGSSNWYEGMEIVGGVCMNLAGPGNGSMC